MATVYADRAYITVNGAKVFDLQSASLKQNMNAKPVPNMTEDEFNTGFVAGNRTIDIMLQIAVQNTLSRPKLENLPYKTASVQLTYVVGAEQFVCTGLFMKDTDDNSSGIGDESKTTFNLGALKVTDAVGNSVLFNLSL